MNTLPCFGKALQVACLPALGADTSQADIATPVPSGGRHPPFAVLPWRQAVGLSLTATAAFHLAFSEARCAALIVLFLGGMFELSRLSTTRQAFYTGLVIGMAVYAPQLAFFWRIFGASAAVLWLILALWLGLFLLLARLIRGQFGPITTAALIPFLWLALEYFRSELYPLRFSWFSAAYAFAHAPLVFQATHLGVYGIGWVLMAMVALLSRLPRWPRFLAGAAALAMLGVLTQPSFAPQAIPQYPMAGFSVAGMQKELPGPVEIELALNGLQARHPEASLYMLSEYTLDGPPTTRLLKWCQRHQKYLVIGGKDPLPGNRFFNTTFVIDPSGRVVHKQAKSVPIQFFNDGQPATRLELWKSPWGKIGICVCYDLSYRRVVDRLVRNGAQALLVPALELTDWGAQAHRLNALVTLVRAAEYGIPVFRVTGSGISQLVNSRGQLIASAPFPGEDATLAGPCAIAKRGSLPWDYYLAPCSLAIVGMAFLGIGGRRWHQKQPDLSL